MEELQEMLFPNQLNTPKISNVINLNKTNDFDKLLRITAFVRRFTNKLKEKRLNQPIYSIKKNVTVGERTTATGSMVKRK